jgi:hypothetical protein
VIRIAISQAAFEAIVACLDRGRRALTARWLNTIGLGLGVAGVVILFIWGPPQPTFDEEAYLLLTGPDVQHVEDVRRLKHQYQIMSSFGLVLIGLGFGAQLMAVWRAPR